MKNSPSSHRTPPQQQNRGDFRRLQKLHLAVVEDHCDIIPFLHAAFRKKLCRSTNLLLVHFDAHPDLAVPTISTLSDWNDLTLLHDTLEDDISGISQFILPLVANGILSKVVWVRSPWSHQLTNGRYQFHIGDVRTTRSNNDKDGKDDMKRSAAVTCAHSYYLDDDSYRAPQDLDMSSAKSVDLTVTTTQSALATRQLDDDDGCSNNNVIDMIIDGFSSAGDDVCWILDICLDYFSTLNPFLPQLVAALQRDLSLSPSPLRGDTFPSGQALSTIIDVFKHMPFRACDPGAMCSMASEPRQQRQQCFELLESLLELPCRGRDGPTDDPDPPEKRQRRCSDDGVSARFVALYSTPASSSSRHDEEKEGQRDISCRGRQAAIAFIELLPHLSAATCLLIKDVGSAVLLPDHVSNDQEIETLISQVTEYLQTLQVRLETATAPPHQQPRTLGHPALITIARSATDGFIPSDVVDRVQTRVIAAVKALLHTHWDAHHNVRTELIVHNLAEDAAARAYTMFLNPAAKQYCT